MPCVYDDVPGSWGSQSAAWPCINDPDGEARRLVITGKLVPYGSYVTVGAQLRLETPEYVRIVREAMTRPAESVAQGREWMLRLAKEIKANAEDHPGDYIAKFALAWADELAARAISSTPTPATGSGGEAAELAAYEAWFTGEQGKAYDGMWTFARAAWLARAAHPAQAGGEES